MESEEGYLFLGFYRLLAPSSGSLCEILRANFLKKSLRADLLEEKDTGSRLSETSHLLLQYS